MIEFKLYCGKKAYKNLYRFLIRALFFTYILNPKMKGFATGFFDADDSQRLW